MISIYSHQSQIIIPKGLTIYKLQNEKGGKAKLAKTARRKAREKSILPEIKANKEPGKMGKPQNTTTLLKSAKTSFLSGEIV